MSDPARPVWFLSEALDRIARVSGATDRGAALTLFAEAYATNPELRATGLPRWSDSLRRRVRQDDYGGLNPEIWRRLWFGKAEAVRDGEHTNVRFSETRFELRRRVTFTCCISEIQVRREDIEALWPLRSQTMPPLVFIEPKEAVRLVRTVFGCSGDAAEAFLRDRWLAGELAPRFTRGTPPAGTDPRMADWFAGAVFLPDKVYQRRAMSEPGDDPEWQHVGGQSFPFLIDRQQLEEALRNVGAAPAAPSNPIFAPVKEGSMNVRTGGLPEDAFSFAQAIALLAPIMGQHYPELEARRALSEGAAAETLTGYGRPDRASHYDALQASLWSWCKIVPDGQGNYDLRCNHRGIMSASCDIHFSRVDVERYRDYLTANRSASFANPMAATEQDPAGRSPDPAPSHDSASAAVQAMRSAYARLVSEGQITTSDSNKARHTKVRDAAEVKAYIAENGKERGLSDDTFNREVIKANWPGKPQVPAAKP
jgi:hypothetical protein